MNEIALSSLLSDELGFNDIWDLHEPASWRTGRAIPNVERVFKVQDVPVVYFARLAEADPTLLYELHRSVWNESKVPLLYVVLPHEIRIYNVYATPAANSVDFEQEEKTRLLRRLTDLTNLESARQAIRQELLGTYDRFHLETGSFWSTSDGQQVKPEYRADQTLLRSLGRLRRRLVDDGVPNETAYSFIGRALFVSYLRDRDLLRNESSGQLRSTVASFTEYLSSHSAAYRLFEQLTERFGGDLFPVSPQEKEVISERHLELLRIFLAGEDLVSGQRRLWPYDFRYIPIELISEIYDTFLQDKKRKELSTFNTPLSLVDFILSETLPEESGSTSRVLDPACGSGIFLVRAFQQIVRAWQIRNGRRPDIEVLDSIVREQIFGVDKAEEAVRISAFSLYLAMLDFLSPEEVSSPGFRFPNLLGRNLIYMDFFDRQLAMELGHRKFDRIIGNPPWGRGTLRGPSREWAERSERPIGSGQLAQAFLWRAAEFSSGQGEIAMLAPAKSTIIVASNTHEEFRREFFAKFSVRAIVNFSALVYELFPDSLSPTIALFYSPKQAQYDKPLIYGVPKPSPLSRHLRAIVLDGTEVKYLDWDDLRRSPELWKVALWGSQRDASLILRLKSFPTLDEVGRQLGWNAGEGMQIRGGAENPAPWASSISHLPTDAFEPYVLNSEVLIQLEEATFHRPRKRGRYRAPLVLIHESRCQAALVDKDLIYLHSLIGIVGAEANLDYMKVLVAFINSPLARYYQFLTSTRWAVERGNPVKEDYLRMPFIQPKADNLRFRDLIDVFDRLRLLQEESYTTALDSSAPYREQLQDRLNKLVYELFELTEVDIQQVEDFVDNEIQFFLWAKRRSRKLDENPTVRPPTVSQLRGYAEAFMEPVDSLLAFQELALNGIVYTNGGPLTVVGFRLSNSDSKGVVRVSEGHELYDVLRDLDQLLLERRSETVCSSAREAVRRSDDLLH